VLCENVEFYRIQTGPQLYRIQTGPQLYRIQTGPQFNKWRNKKNEGKTEGITIKEVLNRETINKESFLYFLCRSSTAVFMFEQDVVNCVYV